MQPISRPTMDHLDELEAQSIYILREAFARLKFREGGDLAIIANGTLVHHALAAAERLAGEGVSARVVNMSTVSPLDVEAIAASAETGAIVTAEEGLAHGGLGGAVAEYCAQHKPVRMRMLGFPGFLPTGSAEWLMERYGLSGEGIASAARELLEARNA